ncbi:MAG: histidine kinase [Chloroflexi bacterium]|nr:MAG: histidine kinase [Chloroflexota bacterium]
MSAERVRELEEKIAEFKRRIPPHSVPPAMLQELEELEEQLEKAKETGKES